MPTKKLNKKEKQFLVALGQRIEKIIKSDLKYKSLDAFSLEFHDGVAKPTLYQICDGKRDMKISTLLGLCKVLDVRPEDLIEGLF